MTFCLHIFSLICPVSWYTFLNIRVNWVLCWAVLLLLYLWCACFDSLGNCLAKHADMLWCVAVSELGGHAAVILVVWRCNHLYSGFCC